MFLLNDKRQFKGLVVFVLVFALLITGCAGPLVRTASAGGPSVAEQLGITNEEESYEMPEIIEEEIDLLGEDVDLRSKYIKQFVREDKAIQAVLYEQAVHYEEDGVFKDIDNTLVLNRDEKGAEVYKNRDNGYYNVSLNTNENTKGDTILMERQGSSLSWRLVSVNTGAKVALTKESGEKRIEILTNNTAQKRTQASKNEQMVMMDKLTSGAKYSNVYKGVSLEYFMLPEKVKENIVLDSYINNAEFVFSISMKNVEAVQRKDGIVVLTNTITGEEVFYIEKPFMEDTNFEYSDKVSMSIKKDGENTLLVIKPDDEWLKNAAYPVKIDPTVYTTISRSNILDTYVSEGLPNSNFYLGSMLKVGEGNTSLTNYAFIKYNELPEIDSSETIVDARQFNTLWKNNDNNDVQIDVHAVNGDWTSSEIKWNNMPSYDSTIVDYEIVSTPGGSPTDYSWEITSIAREWYKSGNNYGFMLKMSDNYDDEYVEFASVDGIAGFPIAQITYVSNAGLEGYWSYHSQSAGRAGTGRINDFNGNLVWVHNDVSMTGNRMPVSISHIYNSCYIHESNDADYDKYKLSDGWKLNLHQEVDFERIGTSITIDYYTYIDSDGTKHYFSEDDGEWKIESGLDLTLEVNDSDSVITITDKSDNILEFDMPDDGGKLKKVTDKNGNYQTLNYDTSGKLISVVDGADRTTNLYYDANGKLEKIIDPSGKEIKFSYVSDRLKYIEYPDSTSLNPRKTEFSYDSRGYLTRVSNYDGYKLDYQYESAASYAPYRVVQVDETGGTTGGGRLSISYGGNRTTFTDYSGREEYLHFDDYGRTIGAVNDQGQGKYFGYYTGTDDINNNKLTSSSRMQGVVVNLLNNCSAEFDRNWSFSNNENIPEKAVRYDTSQTAHFGDQTILLVKQNDIGYERFQQDLTVTKGQEYTFSAYGKFTSSTAPVKLYAKYYDSDDSEWKEFYSKELSVGDSWERLVVTFSVPSNAGSDIVKVGAILTGQGTAYFDDFQLEKGNVANRCNLIENTDFNGPDGGCPTYFTRNEVVSGDGLVTLSSLGYPSGLDSTAYKLNGNAQHSKALAQTYDISGEAGDVYTVMGWAKANSVQSDSTFEIVVKFYNDDTEDPYTWRRVGFNKDTSTWQMASMQAVADKNYNKIKVYFGYFNQENFAYFDGLSLFKESFGQSYTYDSKGNLVSASDLKEQQSSCEYSENDDLTSFTTPKGSKYEYHYDDKHNIKRTKSPEFIDQFFDYDQYGNIITSEINHNGYRTGSFIKATASYSNDGNYLDIVTDSRGKQTDYDYNNTTGMLDEVTTPNGDSTRYEYYAGNDMLEYVYLDANNDGVRDSDEINTRYTYVGDRLSRIIINNAFSYRFTYDGFGNNTHVNIGTQNLITNTFDVRKGLLTNSTYANGDYAAYTYDDLDRITALNYNGVGSGTEFTYDYLANGMLGYMTDNVTGVKTRFLYDASGRLGMVERDNGIISWYHYDDDLSLKTTTEQFFEYIEDSDSTYKTVYNTDEDGRPTSTTISVDNSTEYKVSYSYDTLNRTTSKKYLTGTEEKYSENYTFAQGAQGSETALISSVQYSGGNTLSYNYDDNGNISNISDGTNTIQYYYDELNQLERENNTYLGKTITYNYDKLGNIDFKTEYDVVTADTVTPKGTATTIQYTYDTTWDDKLTNYNGNQITYDQNGNPLSYGDWTYTWKWGRRLATASSTNGISTSYKYNDSGLRTYKEVTQGGSTTKYNYNLTGGSITYEKRSTDDVIDCQLYYAYDNSGKLYGFYYDGAGTTEDGFYYYKRNIQGDIIGILNSDCTDEVVTYKYDTWGKHDSSDIGGALATTVGADNPFRYRGYYYDTETSLYYLNQRYYNPEWGRFINPDDLLGQTGELLSHNLFAYCKNNPVMFCDPSGRIVVSTAVIGTVALVGVLCALLSTTLAQQQVMHGPDLFSYIKDLSININVNNNSQALQSALILNSQLEKSLAQVMPKVKERPNYKNTDPNHHIVARNHPDAEPARDVLESVGINVNDSRNLVQLKVSLHYVMHSPLYYKTVNTIMESAEKTGTVEAALAAMKEYLAYVNTFMP